MYCTHVRHRIFRFIPPSRYSRFFLRRPRVFFSGDNPPPPYYLLRPFAIPINRPLNPRRAFRHYYIRGIRLYCCSFFQPCFLHVHTTSVLASVIFDKRIHLSFLASFSRLLRGRRVSFCPPPPTTPPPHPASSPPFSRFLLLVRFFAPQGIPPLPNTPAREQQQPEGVGGAVLPAAVDERVPPSALESGSDNRQRQRLRRKVRFSVCTCCCVTTRASIDAAHFLADTGRTDGAPQLTVLTAGAPQLTILTDGAPQLAVWADGAPHLTVLIDEVPQLTNLTDGAPQLAVLTDGAPQLTILTYEAP